MMEGHLKTRATVTTGGSTGRKDDSDAPTPEPDVYVAATDVHVDASSATLKEELGDDVEFSASSGNNNGKQREETNQATLLQQEKRYIAYPRIFQQKGPDSKGEKVAEKSAVTVSLGVKSHAVSGAGANAGTRLPKIGGIIKNKSRIVSRHATNRKKRNTNRGLGKNQPNVDSSPDDHNNSERDLPVMRGLGKNRGRMVCGGAEGTEASPEAINAEPFESLSSGGEELESHRTVVDGHDDGDASTIIEEETLLDYQLDDQRQSGEYQPPQPPTPTPNIVPSIDDGLVEDTMPENNNDGLVEAMPVDTEQIDFNMMQAQPIDQEDLEQQAVKEARELQHRRIALGFVVIACIVLTLSLAIGLTDEKKTTVVTGREKDAPTPSPTRGKPLPAMENLELLYAELSEKTRESLYDEESPQYEAWEWLLNHPNITTLPQWRKKQIFALATFYHAIEGPTWPLSIRRNWLNYSVSECSWINTDVRMLMGLSILYLRTDSYDFRPCNDAGDGSAIS